jgi:hypothetical protein
MEGTRSEKLTVVMTPALLGRLKAYAEQNHWSLSTAAAVLIEDGLKAHGF